LGGLVGNNPVFVLPMIEQGRSFLSSSSGQRRRQRNPNREQFQAPYFSENGDCWDDLYRSKPPQGARDRVSQESLEKLKNCMDFNQSGPKNLGLWNRSPDQEQFVTYLYNLMKNSMKTSE
jgi:hypothetical protein